jgi:hypothetical protein
MEENFDKNVFNVHIDNVINSNEFSGIVKLLAFKLKENPYLSLGEYFKSLSDTDLDTLNDWAEQTYEYNLAIANGEDAEPPKSDDDILMLSLLLNQAEGGDVSLDLVQIQKAMALFTTLSVFVSLERKGLINLEYDKMSLQEDMMDAVVATKKEGIDYDSLLDSLDDEDD